MVPLGTTQNHSPGDSTISIWPRLTDKETEALTEDDICSKTHSRSTALGAEQEGRLL